MQNSYSETLFIRTLSYNLMDEKDFDPRNVKLGKLRAYL